MLYMVALVCAATLIYLLRRRTPPPWWVTPTLALVASSALMAASLGQWLILPFSGIFSQAAAVFGVSTDVVAGAIALIMLVIVVYDIGVDKRADKPALTCVALLPPVGLAAGGVVGAFLTALFSGIADVSQSGLSAMLGG